MSSQSLYPGIKKSTLLYIGLVISISYVSSQGIQPFKENPWYWEYKGIPVLLRGGSDEDNLFQWTGKTLTDHLDLLVSVGGNYLRNTMSDRDEGNVHPVIRMKNGKYDLDQWNNEYWQRLEYFLEETWKRQIFVQLTLWDIYDMGGQSFSIHPTNPTNNINWEKGLVSSRYDYYGGGLHIPDVLKYQEAFVSKLISISFKYDHVLYNIQNESVLGDEWENYWAIFLLEQAEKVNKVINISSMRMSPDNTIRNVLTYPELFSFAEISQNNQDAVGGKNISHWENIIRWRKLIESSPGGPLPMNNEKIYGSNVGMNYAAGTGKDAEERFWKNIFAGAASVRFHRPATNWGIGLSERAQINLKALDILLDKVSIFSLSPYFEYELIGPSEAYVMAEPGKQYIVYMPGSLNSIELDPWVYADRYEISYLSIETGTWTQPEIISLSVADQGSYYGLSGKETFYDGGFTSYYGEQSGIIIASPGPGPYIAVMNVIK